MYGLHSQGYSISEADLTPGDILRSEFGRTKRTVVAIDGDDVILRTPAGLVETIPVKSACQFWRRIGTAS